MDVLASLREIPSQKFSILHGFEKTFFMRIILVSLPPSQTPFPSGRGQRYEDTAFPLF